MNKNVYICRKASTMTDYVPNPCDLSAIELPESLKELVEPLSKNVHEVWAAGRLADGWKFGPVRDDIKKEHPSLIPYEELTEEEKDYDRATAISTVRYILSKGYTISKI